LIIVDEHGEQYLVSSDGIHCGSTARAKARLCPFGATALCRDGTYSYIEHPYSVGTCSHHGGVGEHLE
jgi:uridine phosphorylase